MKTTLVVLEPDQPYQTTFTESTNDLAIDQSIQEITTTLNNTCISKPEKPDKHYSSASLTFYSKQKGFMMCNEYRYREKKTLIHPIGGKTETYDNNILSTAVREFIEETDLLTHESINNSLSMDKNSLIEYVYNLIEPHCIYEDVCVNDAKNYHHRYYVFLIDKIVKNTNVDLDNFLKHMITLDKFFNGTHSTEIQSICWKKFNDGKKHKNSWMTRHFVRLFGKYK